jgi:hypothetical protein
MTSLCAYLCAHYGGSNNGIFVNRPMRGSTHPSLHRDGRALDWLQPDDQARARGAQFCADNAAALNIQEINRYKESLAWNPTIGWHHATGEAFGASWANCIHVERKLDGSADVRTIDEILATHTPVTRPTPEVDVFLIKSTTGYAASDFITKNVLGPKEKTDFIRAYTDAYGHAPPVTTVDDAVFAAIKDA